jgi:hypothetical protein
MCDTCEHLETKFTGKIWLWLIPKLFVFKLNWVKSAWIMQKSTQWSVHSGPWPMMKHLKCSIQSRLWPVTGHSVEMVQYLHSSPLYLFDKLTTTPLMCKPTAYLHAYYLQCIGVTCSCSHVDSCIYIALPYHSPPPLLPLFPSFSSFSNNLSNFALGLTSLSFEFPP